MQRGEQVLALLDVLPHGDDEVLHLPSKFFFFSLRFNVSGDRVRLLLGLSLQTQEFCIYVLRLHPAHDAQLVRREVFRKSRRRLCFGK